MDFQRLIKNNILIFDGAMGTMLQAHGMKLGELPELYNLTNPEVIIGIHKEYVAAGADVITANTFQAHEEKLAGKASVEDIISSGVHCARKAGAKYVALDVGPTGHLLKPIGTVSFEEAYDMFARQVTAGVKAGADMIILETFSDLYEAKVAILAAKENSTLPVICSMTFQDDARTFLGSDALTMILTLQSLGIDAIGVNCSLGPKRLVPIVETILEYSSLPVIVQANAGLPEIYGSDTHFHMTPQMYVDELTPLIEKGVRIVGGCCGTTPEHIHLIKETFTATLPHPNPPKRVTACTSGTRSVIFEDEFVKIGERLNPTGKKAMQQALRENNMSYLTGEALAQVEAGANVLDVNVGIPDIDEKSMLKQAVYEVQSITDAPLQIDSSDTSALALAARFYNGKPIINSVNGKTESMDAVFPIVRKYGALVICLTLDENGIPPLAEGRFEIAKRMRNRAHEFGISDENLIVDCLVLTASAQQAEVKETLKAISLVKSKLGLKTVLGVSNVSFGLPNRELLNATFLSLAIGAGLDSAIMNPHSARMREILAASAVLNNEDKNAMKFIAHHNSDKSSSAPVSVVPKTSFSLQELITRGLKDLTEAAVTEALKEKSALEIIDDSFIPALNIVGERFAKGEIFLPQLLLSAQAVQNGFTVISRQMSEGEERGLSKGRILLATVHGDIHDIGKNIVKMLLQSYGYEVIDLGKDVPIHEVVNKVREEKIQLVGLSALMTTTVTSMKETIAAVREAGISCRFFVGGAVLTQEYADFVGADYYAKDAMDGVAIAKEFFSN